MNTEEVALPWFPITPEYIDQYHESVLKYIRDVRNDESSIYLQTAHTLRQVAYCSNEQNKSRQKYVQLNSGK